MLYKTKYQSFLGELTLIADENKLLKLMFEEENDKATEKADLPVFLKTTAWLDDYFNHKKPSISALQFSFEDSIFKMLVWKLLCEIPYGKVVTYGELAKKIAKIKGINKMSAQAVGQAVGKNPLSIIVPCHRVVGVNGNLTGYGGGLKRKIHLLKHEGLNMDNYYLPSKSKFLF